MQSLMITTILAGILGTIQPSLADEGWQHRNLRSEAGVEITFDYKTRQPLFNGCYKCTRPTLTGPTWVNIEHPGLGPEDRVRVVLMNLAKRPYYTYAFEGWEREAENQIDLVYAGPGRFSAPIEDLVVFASGYGGTTFYRQEIAVVINGEWQADPITRTHNFKLSLYE